VGRLPSLPRAGGLNQIKWQAESCFMEANIPKSWRAKILRILNVFRFKMFDTREPIKWFIIALDSEI